MPKTNEPETSTLSDSMLCTILDSIQKQNENIVRLGEDMLRLFIQSEDENRHRAAEIENLREIVAELQVEFKSLAADVFASIITEDNENASTVINHIENMARTRELSELAAVRSARRFIMADIFNEELGKEIVATLRDAYAITKSTNKLRLQIEGEKKKEVDTLIMKCSQEKQDGEEKEEGSQEEEEEEEKKPAKRSPAKKATNKRKKGSSDDEESASNDGASDEEYNPKNPKADPKKNKPGKQGNNGSDSDSDKDWDNVVGSKGGYTRAITLSPELSAVVGAEQMDRKDVLKKIWSIIKERNLYDPKNKQYAICDDELLNIIGVKRFRIFGILKYLKNHFVD